MMKTLVAGVLGLALTLSMSACGDEDVSPDVRRKASEAALRATGGGVVTEVERGRGDDKYTYEVEVTYNSGADVDVELDENFKVLNSPPRATDFTPSPSASADATDDADLDSDDRPLTGDTLNRASAAALKATGTGKVIETGGSDDRDHAYEVDVLLPNGEDVTVELDRAYKVTKIDR